MPRKKKSTIIVRTKTREQVLASLDEYKTIQRYTLAVTHGNDLVVVDPTGLRAFLELSPRRDPPLRFLGRVTSIPKAVEQEAVAFLHRQRDVRKLIAKDPSLHVVDDSIL